MRACWRRPARPLRKNPWRIKADTQLNSPTLAPSGVFSRRHTGVLVAAFLLQLALLALAFPLPGWEQGQGLFYIDHPFHLYQVTLGRALLEHGSLVGYDPFFGGGNLGGVTINLSARLPVLISSVVPASVSTANLYLCYVFLCALLAPLSLASVGALLRWPVFQTGVAAVLGTLFWWIGALHWYHTAGMVSFVFACYTSITYAVLVFQIISAKGDKFPYTSICAAGILGGFGLWLHPLFGVMAAVVIAGFLLAHFRELNLISTLVRGTVIGLIAFVLNIPWILAMRTGANMMASESVYQIDFGFKFLANAILGVWHRSMGSLLNPLVVALGLLAMFIVKSERRRDFIAFSAIGSAFIIFAAFGATVNILSTLQPNRFFAPGFLIIGIAATYALPEVKSWLQSRRKPVMGMVVLAVALLLSTILARELIREAIPGTHGRYGKTPPEVTYPPATVTWLTSWINEHTSNDGRILFETSLGRKHGGGHAAGYLALETNREFIGAPYPFLMPERSFWDKVGFGRPLAELTTRRFVEGLDLYNVGWIITHSEELARRVSELPQVRLLAQKDDVHIFGIERPLSYFKIGDASVVARDFNRLEVTAKAGDKLIMRYQWIKGLSTTPPSSIEPISLSPDFPPFIQISNAPAHFLIHLNR